MKEKNLTTRDVARKVCYRAAPPNQPHYECTEHRNSIDETQSGLKQGLRLKVMDGR